jgi:hypothetical protein
MWGFSCGIESFKYRNSSSRGCGFIRYFHYDTLAWPNTTSTSMKKLFLTSTDLRYDDDAG